MGEELTSNSQSIPFIQEAFLALSSGGANTFKYIVPTHQNPSSSPLVAYDRVDFASYSDSRLSNAFDGFKLRNPSMVRPNLA